MLYYSVSKYNINLVEYVVDYEMQIILFSWSNTKWRTSSQPV